MTNTTPSQPQNQPQPQSQKKPNSQPRRLAQRSVVLPLALILAGAAALLINLNVVPAAAGWALAQLWPLLLVAWGLELVAPRNWGRGAGLAVLGLAVALVPPGNAAAGLVAGLAVAGFAAHLFSQLRQFAPSDPAACLRLFRSNRDAGLIVALLLAVAGLL